MKAKYKPKDKTTTFVFPEKDFGQKAEAILNYSGEMLTKLLRRKKQAIQIIFKYGYSDMTVKREAERGLELPPYKYFSRVLSKKEIEMKSNVVQEYISNELDLYAEYQTDELNYDEAIDVREVIVRLIQ